jgi:F0F1-type ATP synthase assembly protein I
LGVHTEDKWHIGVGLYIVGLIAYQTTLTFWTAAFPSLARDTTEIITHADELASGRISEEYEFADTMKRSQLANVAFYVQSVAEIGILAVLVGIMFGVDVNVSTANNNWGLSVFIAFASGVWLLFSLPWFFLKKEGWSRSWKEEYCSRWVVAAFVYYASGFPVEAGLALSCW